VVALCRCSTTAQPPAPSLYQVLLVASTMLLQQVAAL
jgi:hypothetical protein